jgi:hypothetical protein
MILHGKEGQIIPPGDSPTRPFLTFAYPLLFLSSNLQKSLRFAMIDACGAMQVNRRLQVDKFRESLSFRVSADPYIWLLNQ